MSGEDKKDEIKPVEEGEAKEGDSSSAQQVAGAGAFDMSAMKDMLSGGNLVSEILFLQQLFFFPSPLRVDFSIDTDNLSVTLTSSFENSVLFLSLVLSLLSFSLFSFSLSTTNQ